MLILFTSNLSPWIDQEILTFDIFFLQLLHFSCFLPRGKPLYYGFLVEMLSLVVFNVFIFNLLLRNAVFRPMLLIRKPHQSEKKSKMFFRMKQFVLFWTLLGLSLIFGYLGNIPGREKYGFQILFRLVTTNQGFALTLFSFVKNPDMKTALTQIPSLFFERISNIFTVVAKCKTERRCCRSKQRV